jgi:hypothetical protein
MSSMCGNEIQRELPEGDGTPVAQPAVNGDRASYITITAVISSA